MALLIHVGSHPDELVGRLCQELAVPPADPFTPEVVAVPTRGIERWLTQRIAGEMSGRVPGGGICANLLTPSPAQLVLDTLKAVPALAESVEAWEGNRLLRHVTGAIDDHIDRPWIRVVARYIGGSEGGATHWPGQRLRAARKISGLFTRYARRRPEMIRAWHSGVEAGADGRPLPEDQVWQPEMWRALRDRIGTPCLPELVPDGLAPLRDGSVTLDLPDRLSVYGLTAADPLDLEVLAAIAARRDVHLYLLHPSPELWNRARRVLLPASSTPRRIARTDDPTTDLVRHPLLRSWGRESREFQTVVADRRPALPEAASRPAGHPACLLGRLQDDIRSNRPPSDASPAAVLPDRSVQIHSCHGPGRQVEVLRDAILHVLAADPSLEPRDVVIMTPDLATFAPLIEATFRRHLPEDIDGPITPGNVFDDAGRHDSLPDLRVRIADRAPSATNPLIRFAVAVLDLADSRLEASDVRELIATAVVRELFEIDDETADALAKLIEDATIRWGLDADHRAEWNAGRVDDQTWRRGLDRALSGIFYADSDVRVVPASRPGSPPAGGGAKGARIRPVAPLDGMEGSEALPVGLLAQIVDRIESVRNLLGSPLPYSRWGPAIGASVRLLAAPARRQEWQWGQLERLLEVKFPPPDDGSTDPEVSLAEARLLLADWSSDQPSPLHFRTGDATVCALAPMRSVPYRVVCLLGMDDDRFPRSGGADGDDLLVDQEVIGDADRGAQDRQLLLDAVLFAGDHLLVTYSGRDRLTNAEYPPAVPIAEMVDTLEEMVGAAGVRGIITEHPLQAFSETNFLDGRLGVAGAWGFDRSQLDGAKALQRRDVQASAPPPAFSAGEVPDPIRLEDLLRFLANPGQEFIRAALKFRLPRAVEGPDDLIAARMDSLQEWKVIDRFLTGYLAGHGSATLDARERGMDAVPPGDLAVAGLADAHDLAAVLAEAARTAGYEPDRLERFAGTVKAGERSIEGTVTADPVANCLHLVTPSRLKGKHRLGAYAWLVFLTALDPSRPWSAKLIGRARRKDAGVKVSMVPLGASEEERSVEAAERLAALAALYAEGIAERMLLPVETAYTWQRRRGVGGRDAFEKREKDDPSYRFLFPTIDTMEALVGSTDFPSLAQRLWAPILPLLREKPV